MLSLSSPAGEILTARLARESNAIMLYLVEKYDTTYSISVSNASERAHQLQWLFFQASGQGYVCYSHRNFTSMC